MAHIEWSKREYSLQEFEYTFEYQIPVLIEVSQGYCGYGEDFFTFSCNEIYRVHKLVSQTRIVAKDENGIHYSIPVAYPLRFRVLSKTSWKDLASKKALFLDEILSRCEIDEASPLVIAPEDSDRIKFWQGADRRSSVAFTKLHVISTFEDKYLIANSIIEGRVYDGSIIPLFLGIKVRVAEGLQKNTKEGFDRMLQHFTKSVGKRNDSITLNKEIMIYDSEASEYGVYDYIEPSTYVSCNQASRLRENVLYESPSRPAKQRNSELYTDLSPTVSSKAHSPEPLYLDIKAPQTTPGSVKHLSKTFGKLDLTGGSAKPKTAPKPGPKLAPKPMDENVYDHVRYAPDDRNKRGMRQKRDPLPDPPVESPPIKSESKAPYKYNVYDAKSATAMPITWDTSAAEKEEISDEKKEKIYETYKDVPKSVKNMTKSEVADCLRLMGFEKYIEKFLDNEVDGALLLDLDNEMLMQDFGFTRFEAVKMVKFSKSGWRPK